MLLQDQVVIVSGIGPGLGQELARACGREGAKVVLAARTESYLNEVAEKLRTRGIDCLIVPTDVADKAQCQALIDETVEYYGRVDGLVNSAYTPGPMEMFENADLGAWRQTMEVNLFGALQLIQACVPHMKQQGGGSVVNINTMVQRKPIPMQSGYGASKGAMTAATRMLAKELGGYKIRVNQVYMGWMWGPPVEHFVRGEAKRRGMTPDEVIAEICQQIPLGEIPNDDDCANAVVFFLSGLSRVITGASLDCNGGEFMP